MFALTVVAWVLARQVSRDALLEYSVTDDSESQETGHSASFALI
jgi:hypothetical protein